MKLRYTMISEFFNNYKIKRWVIMKNDNNYKIRDWVTIAMVAAVLGVLFIFLDGLYTPLSNLLGPVFLGITYGIYTLSALLPAYLLKKPGASLIGSLFASGINMLGGSPYGVNILLAGLLQGLGAEIGFGIFKYKKYSILNFFFSAIFMTSFVFIRDYFIFGLSQLPTSILIQTYLVRTFSTAIIGYLLCFVIRKGLVKAGFNYYEN